MSSYRDRGFASGLPMPTSCYIPALYPAVSLSFMLIVFLSLSVAIGSAQKLKTLYSFTGGVDGKWPWAGQLFLDAKGNLYGTTLRGGVNGNGVMFKVNPMGQETVLHDFLASEGCEPLGLLRDGKGNFYVPNWLCGIYGYGTIFELTKQGVGIVQYSFTGGTDGGEVEPGLTRDVLGNLYGETQIGGDLTCLDAGCGTVFEVTSSGTQIVLYTFKGGTDGGAPSGGLLHDGKGNLYGTTAVFGDACCGTVFELTPPGTYEVKFSFDYADGSAPGSRMVRDSKGNLYGTTGGGGTSENGTIFELTKKGTVIVLHNFTGGADGAGPYGGIIRDTKGNLYGTTFQGAGSGCGGIGCGTVYEVDPAGNFTVLHTFTGKADGGQPDSSLVLDKHGVLYGTTSIGGKYDVGTVFVLTPQGLNLRNIAVALNNPD